jgi:FkbM family methyltransferase
MTMQSSSSKRARQFYQAYRHGPLRIGHSLIRRFFESCLARHQVIQLRSGLKLDLDLSKGNQSAIFWSDGDVDLHLYWAIRELLPLGGWFVDCGANCGLMGLLARQYRSARVVFIEPHPRLASSIRANIAINDFAADCELIEAAVSDASGEVAFYEDPRNDGSHSVHGDWGDKMKIIGKVSCLKLSEILQTRSLQRIHFLKVDTEGNDWNALKSLDKYLRPEQVEVVYAEMTKDRAAATELMRSRGYIGFAATGGGRREIFRQKRLYEAGGQVCFYEPLNEKLHRLGDVLWCGEASTTAQHLRKLYAQA